MDLKEIQQIDGVCVSTQQIINVEGGDILHAIKNDEESFKSFGEAYFSIIEHNFVKTNTLLCFVEECLTIEQNY